MKFFQFLFYNQYAEISRRGGNARQAQFNTIILSTALITLFIIFSFVLYGKYHPGFLEKYFSFGSMNGKTTGKLLGVVIGVVIYFLLKFFVGSKSWYDQAVDQFNMMSREEQDRASKTGLRYFFFFFLPIMAVIIWILVTSF